MKDITTMMETALSITFSVYIVVEERFLALYGGVSEKNHSTKQRTTETFKWFLALSWLR